MVCFLLLMITKAQFSPPPNYSHYFGVSLPHVFVLELVLEELLGIVCK